MYQAANALTERIQQFRTEAANRHLSRINGTRTTWIHVEGDYKHQLRILYGTETEAVLKRTP